MPKLTIAQARAQGYKIDTTCYPHIGYIRNRFEPDTRLVMPQVEVFTEIEGDLLEVCEELVILVDDADYVPDSFTTQPARMAIAKAREVKNG